MVRDTEYCIANTPNAYAALNCKCLIVDAIFKKGRVLSTNKNSELFVASQVNEGNEMSM